MVFKAGRSPIGCQMRNEEDVGEKCLGKKPNNDMRITHVYKYKVFKRWDNQKDGSRKEGRKSLTGFHWLWNQVTWQSFTEFETHKVSTEEVIFSSTAGSPTKTKKFKKKRKKENWFSLSFATFQMFRQREFVFQGTQLDNKSGSKELTFRVYSPLYMRAALTQYIIILYTYCFREKFVKMYISDWF